MFGYGWIGLFSKRRPPPEREAWKPRFPRGVGPAEPACEKHRGIRLRRKRTSRMQPTPLLIRLALLAAIIGFVLVVWRVFAGPGD